MLLDKGKCYFWPRQSLTMKIDLLQEYEAEKIISRCKTIFNISATQMESMPCYWGLEYINCTPYEGVYIAKNKGLSVSDGKAGDLESVEYHYSPSPLWSGVLIRVQSMGQINLFRNNSYSIRPCAKKTFKKLKKKCKNKCTMNVIPRHLGIK